MKTANTLQLSKDGPVFQILSPQHLTPIAFWHDKESWKPKMSVFLFFVAYVTSAVLQNFNRVVLDLCLSPSANHQNSVPLLNIASAIATEVSNYYRMIPYLLELLPYHVVEWLILVLGVAIESLCYLLCLSKVFSRLVL
jgi:hypothetical protein